MIDLHSHILNGIDDGPAEIEESLALARRYVEAGFSRVVATPHWIMGTAWMMKIEDIRSRVESFNDVLQGEGIAIQVFSGMEIAMDEEIPAMLSQGRLLTLADAGYLLVETPFQRLPSNWEQLFYNIIAKGYRILLAHPERCAQIIAKPEMMHEIISSGVYVQCNYDSFIGGYGDAIYRAARKMLLNGYVHCLATDSHDSFLRQPGNAATAIDHIGKIIDRKLLHLITMENPIRLMNGLPLEIPSLVNLETDSKNKKKWLFF